MRLPVHQQDILAAFPDETDQLHLVIGLSYMAGEGLAVTVSVIIAYIGNVAGGIFGGIQADKVQIFRLRCANIHICGTSVRHGIRCGFFDSFL